MINITQKKHYSLCAQWLDVHLSLSLESLMNEYKELTKMKWGIPIYRDAHTSLENVQ